MLSKKSILKTVSYAMILGLSLTGCNSKVSSKSRDKKEDTVQFSSISTEDAEKYALDDDYIFVDTRNDSYYNGFKQDGLARGGHIEGALQYSADWIGRVNDNKLAKFVEDKGIDKKKKIIVYDTDLENTKKVAKMLKRFSL